MVSSPRGNNRNVRIAFPFNNREIESGVISILRSRKLVQGGVVREFEKALSEHIGSRNVVCLNSGTAALHCAILSLRISDRRGRNKVITTPLSFAATANAITHAGCQPTFVDVDPETFNIDPKLLNASIDEKTLAIEPVDVYGLPAELEEINYIARRNKIHVVEDAAEAIGAVHKGKKIGSISTLTCFSTYATKNLHTAEGGFVTTSNDSLAASMRKIRNQGQVSRYNQTTIGYNFRMLEFCAAIGLAQLPILEELNRKRMEHVLYLKEELSKFDFLGFQKVDRPKDHAWYLFSLILDEKRAKMKRDLFVQKIKERGIESDVAWPTPIHLQPYFKKTLGYKKGSFPIAEKICKTVFQLPIHPFLKQRDLEKIVKVLKDTLRN